MKTNRISKLMLAAVLSVAGLAAATPDVKAAPDQVLAQKVAHEVRMYSRYTIWDNVKVRVNDGNVELEGQVSQPFKRADLQRLAQRTPGVTSVTNRLEVLPTSFYDDELRIRVARAIYRDATLSRYAIQAVPPIHIIVNNGHVTLEGVVNSQMEKTVAGIRASSAGLSLGQVVNNLRVENASRKG